MHKIGPVSVFSIAGSIALRLLICVIRSQITTRCLEGQRQTLVIEMQKSVGFCSYTKKILIMSNFMLEPLAAHVLYNRACSMIGDDFVVSEVFTSI